MDTVDIRSFIDPVDKEYRDIRITGSKRFFHVHVV